ncbi:MAG: DsbA family oxidoreductase [Ideonella sp.]|nr:DsbA family oxidoreductase [Ideonella sp.]
MTAPHPIKIDFVSDIVCPWCAIGLASLETALQRLDGVVQAEVQVQPFQLNPDMAPEGEDIIEHLARKYGMTAEQVRSNQAAIRQRGAEVGFAFSLEGRSRTWNTFDAHRLVHWASLQGQALALKHALLTAYFTEGRNVADHSVLLDKVAAVGLDVAAARAVLDSDAHAAAVRERLDFYRGQGIGSVPSIIINDRHLIQGGQPPEVFEQALRKLATAAD